MEVEKYNNNGNSIVCAYSINHRPLYSGCVAWIDVYIHTRDSLRAVNRPLWLYNTRYVCMTYYSIGPYVLFLFPGPAVGVSKFYCLVDETIEFTSERWRIPRPQKAWCVFMGAAPSPVGWSINRGRRVRRRKNTRDSNGKAVKTRGRKKTDQLFRGAGLFSK